MNNIYKPKYKICFQTKNKIWINKNSRLRNFYNIRNKIVLERAKKFRKFLVLKNMKWTVARRFMLPYLKKKTSFIYNYKNSFFLKQQLKKFYGKLREHHLRKIFKKTWNKEQYFRRNIFIMALEQRLDIVIYRMRLLPSIYACHQLVSHQGIYVNQNLITIPNYKVKIGDIVSVKNEQWPLFYNNIYYKIKKRFFAENLLRWRNHLLMAKIQKIGFKRKNLYKKNLFLFKEFDLNKKKYYSYKNLVLNRYKFYLNKQNKTVSDKKKLKFFKNLYLLLGHKVSRKISLIQTNIWKIRYWKNNNYSKNLNLVLYHNYYFTDILNTFKLILNTQILTWKYQNRLKKIKQLKQITVLKRKKIDQLNTNYLNKLNKFQIYYKNNNYLLKNRVRNSVEEKFIQLNDVSKSMFLNNFTRYLVNRLKYKKMKKNTFKQWAKKHHWYTPNYLEVDYKTLRASFISYPKSNEVVYAFPCSFDKIISFYKERAL